MQTWISLVQFQPSLAQPEENVRRLEPLFQEIGDSSLVILPELANSGYNFRNFDQAYACAEIIGENGVFQDFLHSVASAKGIYIVSGINERDKGNLFNTAVLIGPEGVAGKYRKTHLFMNEKDLFQKGNTGFPVFDVGDFKIGIQICFDYLFPEPWRILAEKGADLVCHPSNLLTENAQRCLPGVALMNKIFVATANRIGTEGDLTFNGSSFMTDPAGRILSMASKDKPEVLSFQIDTEKSRNKMITPRNHVFGDRRPEAYHP